MDSVSHKAWLRPTASFVFLGIFAVAFFRLPFHFPVALSASDSYIYQFNNRVAVLIFIAGTAGFAVLSRGLMLQPAERDSRVSPFSALVAILLCVGTGLFYWRLSAPEGLAGENVYFFGRLAQLAAGKTIYRDFEFAYGPLLLYPSYWISRLFHLSLIHGYVVFWLVCWALGIWTLFVVVNAIEIPSPYRTVLFFIFVLDLAQSLWPQGLNYSPIRDLVTAGLALVVFTAHRRGYPSPVIAVAAILGAAIATGVSPEHGLAFMFGTTLFLVLFAKPRPAGFWPSIGVMCAAFLTMVILFDRGGMYVTLRSFSLGGYSYPILPYPGVLCVMALFLVAGCVAYRAIDRDQTNTFFVYLLCICVFSLPAGFGRADSGHMQLGAFSALIVAALALGRYRWISLVAALAFLYWPGTAEFHSDLPKVRESVEDRLFNHAQESSALSRSTISLFHLLHQDAHREAIEEKVARYYPPVISRPLLPSDTIVDAPLGLTIQGYVDTSGQVDYGYFSGLENVTLPSHVDKIIAWLNAHPDREVLLERHWHLICRPFTEHNDALYQNWHGIHWASQKRQDSILVPFCQFIDAHYAPDPNDPDTVWQLWHRTQ